MTIANPAIAPPRGLVGYSIFAALIAAAGLPIYLHAPKFYVDQYGLNLATLGVVLFALRLIEVASDPLLGWLVERLRNWRVLAVSIAATLLAAAMLALFAIKPPIAPILWFALILTVLFTAYSFLNIAFYTTGVHKAGQLGKQGHVRLATWRETGALLGVCVAAVAPTALVFASDQPFALFALGFGALALVAAFAMRGEWEAAPVAEPSSFRVVLADPTARCLLLIALVNATPVAVSSTLFLFFVESRLGAPGMEGPLLLLFFLAAAASTPVWGRAARYYGPKRALLAGMALSITAFGFAALLGTGDVWAFALICLATGAALGADMSLLPAMFAARMARIAPDAGLAFGLWNFVNKFTLAFAAVTLLPALEAGGFVSGAQNSAAALDLLGLLYALIPCALKLVAIALLAATPLKET